MASETVMSYAEMLLAIVPAAPPTRKNQRATSCPAPISAKVPYFVLSRLIWTAFWCVSSGLVCIGSPLRGAGIRVVSLGAAEVISSRSVSRRLDRLDGSIAQRGDHASEHGEPLILGGSADISGVDLLGDHGDLEQAEDVVIEHVRDIAASRSARSARRPRAG